MSGRVSVTVVPNGPLKVSDVESLRFCGQPVEVEGDVYLCRCGESSKAPFCDGSHARTGFVGETPAIEQKGVKNWEGASLRTFFNPNACMHARYCKPLAELRAKEVEGDVDAAQAIMRVVDSCPSGALSYETKTELTEPSRRAGVDVDIMEGGEIRVQRAFDINATLYERRDESRGTLCRCGLSKAKPWCDGMHAARKDFR